MLSSESLIPSINKLQRERSFDFKIIPFIPPADSYSSKNTTPVGLSVRKCFITGIYTTGRRWGWGPALQPLETEGVLGCCYLKTAVTVLSNT